MINIGVDIVNINRIKKLLDKNKDKFLTRIFTKEEILYINSNYKVETIAGMFATKEAVSKALKKGISKNLSWKDIMVLHYDNGSAYIKLSNSFLEKEKIDKYNFDVSISHDTDYAISFVIKY